MCGGVNACDATVTLGVVLSVAADGALVTALLRVVATALGVSTDSVALVTMVSVALYCGMCVRYIVACLMSVCCSGVLCAGRARPTRCCRSRYEATRTWRRRAFRVRWRLPVSRRHCKPSAS